MTDVLALADAVEWDGVTALVAGPCSPALREALTARGVADLRELPVEAGALAAAHGAELDAVVVTARLSALPSKGVHALLASCRECLREKGSLLLATPTFFAPYPGAEPRPATPYAHLAFPSRHIDTVMRARTGAPSGPLNPMGAASYLMLFHRLGYEIVQVELEPGEVPARFADKLVHYEPSEVAVQGLSAVLRRVTDEPAMSVLRGSLKAR